MDAQIRFLALVSLLWGLAPPALATPAEDYVVFRTAAAINAACGGLKYLEHDWALSAAANAIKGAPEQQMVRDGSLSEADYQAWAAELDAQVEQTAAQVGCTQAAMPYINQAKGRASGETYIGVLLAVHFSGQSDELQHLPLSPAQMTTLERYDGYLQAVYGDSFGNFSAQHRQLAVQELPATTGAEMSEDDLAKLRQAKARASRAVASVFFEVTAETAGLLVRPRRAEGGWTLPELRPAGDPAAPGYVVIDGPGRDRLALNAGGTQEVYRVVTLSPQNQLRVMFYGDAAAEIAAGTARFYIRTSPEPEGVSTYDFFADPDFRDGAQAFEGTPVASGCLGSACFDFPPEATAALTAPGAGQYAELFVSPVAGAQPVTTAEPNKSKPGRVSLFSIRKLLAP